MRIWVVQFQRDPQPSWPTAPFDGAMVSSSGFWNRGWRFRRLGGRRGLSCLGYRLKLECGCSVDKIEAISGIPADISSLERGNSSRCSNRRESKAMAESVVTVVAIYIAFLKYSRRASKPPKLPRQPMISASKMYRIDIAPMLWVGFFGFYATSPLDGLPPTADRSCALGRGKWPGIFREIRNDGRSISCHLMLTAGQLFSHVFGL